MSIPNEALDTHTRIQLAKEWLQEHNTESITTAARIFKINRTSLSYSIQKAKNCTRGGSNRISSPNQEKSLNQFIRSYLDHNLLPTKGVILSVIKTKPIARVRITVQDKVMVQEWFGKYREVLRKYNISRKDIWNFDETGFRISCPKGQEIYVPLDIKEVSLISYSLISSNSI